MTTKRKPRAKPSRATLPAPISCVILAVDPGSDRSGWAIYMYGMLIRYGAVDGRESGEIRGVCADALRCAEDHRLDCVLVMEAAISSKYTGTKAGGSRALWRDQWKKAGGVATRVHMVYPQTWRARLFGSSRGLTTEMHHRREHARAVRLGCIFDYGHDTDAAACIGEWATHAQAVFDRLPKTRRRMVS